MTSYTALLRRVVPGAGLYVQEEAAGELAQISLRLLAAACSQTSLAAVARPRAALA